MALLRLAPVARHAVRTAAPSCNPPHGCRHHPTCRRCHRQVGCEGVPSQTPQWPHQGVDLRVLSHRGARELAATAGRVLTPWWQTAALRGGIPGGATFAQPKDTLAPTQEENR